MKVANHRQRDQEVTVPEPKAANLHNEFHGYDAVHGHAQSDIDNYLKGKRDSFDRLERMIAGNDDAEISAEEEREISLANITRMQEIAASHEAGFKRLMMKIRVNDLEHAAQIVADAAAEKKSHIPFPIEDVLIGRGRANPERLHNACRVANELEQRRCRDERFQRRRRACMNEEINKIEMLESRHEEADKRVASCQKELIEKQAEKTCVSQQRHGEQQKMLKEIQRFQDQQFEKLQLKHHPEAVSTSTATKHDHTVSALSSRPMSSAPPDLDAEPQSPTAEPVHRRQVQSRGLYKKTLDKWNVFVTENERRTDAYWSKMLDGQPRKKKSSANINMFRKSVHGVCTIQKFLGTTHASTNMLLLGETQDEDEEPVEALPCTTASPATYEDRLERIRSYQADLDQQAFEKRQRDTATLESKQKKNKEELRRKAEKAKHQNSAWEEKAALSCARREIEALRSDDEIVQKLARAKKDREVQEQRKKEEYDALSSLRTLHYLNVKANAKMQHENMKESLQEKQYAKNDRLAGRLTAIIQGAEDSPKDEEYLDVVKDKVARKSASEQAFSLNVAKSIDMKRGRSEKMKLQVLKPRSPMDTIQRQRALHKEKPKRGSRIPPPELTLTPGWDAGHEDPELADMMCSYPSYASCGSTHTQDSLSPPRQSRISSTSIVPVKTLARVANPGDSKCLSGRSHGSDAQSSEEDDVEEEFLAELQCRSTKWLGVLRKEGEL